MMKRTRKSASGTAAQHVAQIHRPLQRRYDSRSNICLKRSSKQHCATVKGAEHKPEQDNYYTQQRRLGNTSQG